MAKKRSLPLLKNVIGKLQKLSGKRNINGFS